MSHHFLAHFLACFVQNAGGQCQDLKHAASYNFIERLDRCVPTCSADVQFSSEVKTQGELWMIILLVVSLLATTFSFISFLLGSDRLQYPERCLVFLVFSAFGYNLGFLLRLLFGRDAVSCQRSDDDPSLSLLTVEGHRNSSCFTVFLFLYYFSVALTTWNFIGALTWLLSVALDLTHAKLVKYVNVFHVLGWGFPAALTVSAFLQHRIEADEFTGVCFVGSQDADSLLYFVIIPELTLFVLSLLFVVVALLWTCCKKRAEAKTRLKSFSKNMGIFSLFYLIPKVPR